MLETVCKEAQKSPRSLSGVQSMGLRVWWWSQQVLGLLGRSRKPEVSKKDSPRDSSRKEDLMHQEHVSPRWHAAYEELEDIMASIEPRMDIRYMDRDGIKMKNCLFQDWEVVLADWTSTRIDELVQILRQYPDPF
jgi:hypothetical protein